jgi:hypothetical protein
MKTYEDILHFYKGIYSSATSTEKPIPNPLIDAINTILPKTETSGRGVSSPSPSSSLRDLARISVGSVMLRTYLGKHYLYEDRCLSLDEVKNLTTGTKVWCNLKTDKTDWCIGTIYKYDETYIITDVFNGKPPGGRHCKEGEWKKYGKYSWTIIHPKDLGIGVKLAEDYLETTLTKDSRPGKFEVSYEGEKFSVLDTNLSLDEVKNLTTGTKVWCNLLNTDITDWCIGTIFKDSRNTFIVTDVFNGSYPENERYHDWRKYGKFTWLVKITDDLGRGVKLVEVENVKKYTKTEGHSGVVSKTEVNRDLFNRLGVQLGLLNNVKVETDPSLTYDKPNPGDSLTTLKEVKSSTSDSHYSLVKFGDNKFCVINSKNIQ